jgi:altronate hydrolase
MNIQDTGGSQQVHRVAASRGSTRCCRSPTGRARDRCRPATSPSACSAAAPTAIPGITANPALGAAVDILVSHGGTAILSETPEIYGAEHLLTRRRACLAKWARKSSTRIKWWEDYCARNEGEMNNNPSPGNKAGGLTTILREIAWRGRQGRHHQPGAASYEYAERGRPPRASCYMDTPATTRCRPPARSAGRRRPDLLHHRPRLRLWLHAVAVDEARHQHAAASTSA